MSAGQLRAARGEVRCGGCLLSFDAIPYLEDEPAEFDPPLPSSGETPAQEAVPEILREDLDRLRSRERVRRTTVAFTVANLILLLAVAGQYVWFEPEEVWRRYPQSREWIEQLCARTACVLPERRDPSRIRIVSRDVRIHPRYEGALQIRATLTNAGLYPQPYPGLRFTLFNVNGQTIATRWFAPEEYLRSLPASAEMQPDAAVQIALEVLAPEEAAVSFEFQFL